ncbi:uncharacterized protein BJ171DRAFT_509750 [Polychytrium aggregatum]|uniref:uncharacterized protein n=1 Tax=Polychytrium aggregatum TaxID=110093 RepID=UPI0022FE3FB1|nr:uncharacterized protein BJ171DRAFT_509750 [Polychytrium aggregatum]KAI9203485.1 hypothetical protein BJ171DRAFT_509750 [Polychytrium aggregatum]
MPMTSSEFDFNPLEFNFGPSGPSSLQTSPLVSSADLFASLDGSHSTAMLLQDLLMPAGLSASAPALLAESRLPLGFATSPTVSPANECLQDFSNSLFPTPQQSPLSEFVCSDPFASPAASSLALFPSTPSLTQAAAMPSPSISIPWTPATPVVSTPSTPVLPSSGIDLGALIGLAIAGAIKQQPPPPSAAAPATSVANIPPITIQQTYRGQKRNVTAAEIIAEEQLKRQKNTDAARRSRQRKAERMDTLERQIKEMAAERAKFQAQLNAMNERDAARVKEIEALKAALSHANVLLGEVGLGIAELDKPL